MKVKQKRKPCEACGCVRSRAARRRSAEARARGFSAGFAAGLAAHGARRTVSTEAEVWRLRLEVFAPFNADRALGGGRRP